MKPSEALGAYLFVRNYTDHQFARIAEVRLRDLQLALAGVAALPYESKEKVLGILNPEPNHIRILMNLFKNNTSYQLE